MARDFYSARGLNTERLPHTSGTACEGDVQFYTELAREAGSPVLELGCGNGRVLLPLAREGLEVTGLDRSSGMLANLLTRLAGEPAAVRERVSLVEGDMTSFHLGRRFNLVIIAFRSFQMLLTPEAERSCLLAIRNHLSPKGVLVIDIFDPLLHLLVPPDLPSAEGGSEGDKDGRSALVPGIESVILRRSNDVVAQCFEEAWRFRELASDGSILREEEELLRMRWIYRWEMRYLLELSGFSVLAEYSDFLRSPPAYGKEQVWLATLGPTVDEPRRAQS